MEKTSYEWSYTALGKNKYKIMWMKISAKGTSEILCSADYCITGTEEEVEVSLRLNSMALRNSNSSLFEEEQPEAEMMEV